jgi:hypothetical protein
MTNNFVSDQKVELKLKNSKSVSYYVFAVVDDELVLLRENGIHTNFPGKELLLNIVFYLSGAKVGIGDQVQVINENGSISKMYVSYIFDHECITLSSLKRPSKNSLKWLLKLMSNY